MAGDCACAIASLARSKSMGDVKRDNGSPPSYLARAVILGLVSSSCCVIQLAINALSLLGVLGGAGCAGFNIVLGPLRPVTRPLTLAWLVWAWVGAPNRSVGCCADGEAADDARGKGRWRRRLLESGLCLALMFSPEIVTMYGTYARGNLPSALPLPKWLTLDVPAEEMFRAEYVVDNMGCEACVDGVERLLRGRPGVVRGHVASFETGAVEVWLRRDGTAEWGGDRKETFEAGLDNVLRENGYELREKGWVTKKMKMKMEKRSSSTFFSVGGGEF